MTGPFGTAALHLFDETCPFLCRYDLIKFEIVLNDDVRL